MGAEDSTAELTVVYTDGACMGNPGPGGWAWAVEGGRYASGAAAHSTNQRMEITAAAEAVRSNAGRLEVRSDSTYVVNCFGDRWWEGWVARGWRNSRKEPVANRDLWEPLVAAVQARGDVAFRWVKGHRGDAMNDLVDRLAVEAAMAGRGRSGEGWPDRLGPADVPAGRAVERRSGRAAATSSVPEGHLLAVAGHRPPELGGWDPNPVADRVRAKLAEVLSAKAEMHPDLVVLTGLGLGAEQLGAEAATVAGVPYVAVLAFPGPDAPWPEASRRRYRGLVDGAAGQVLLQGRAPATRQQAGAAISRRDAWLARHAAEAVVVWDRREATVGRLVRTLQGQLGEAEVWLIEP